MPFFTCCGMLVLTGCERKVNNTYLGSVSIAVPRLCKKRRQVTHTPAGYSQLDSPHVPLGNQIGMHFTDMKFLLTRSTTFCPVHRASGGGGTRRRNPPSWRAMEGLQYQGLFCFWRSHRGLRSENPMNNSILYLAKDGGSSKNDDHFINCISIGRYQMLETIPGLKTGSSSPVDLSHFNTGPREDLGLKGNEKSLILPQELRNVFTVEIPLSPERIPISRFVFTGRW
ncbi:hypothetical protein F4809DRAFT_587361 [Biscogniauxia mediterranea]|nr:hypothetical protein F4809DRAFT_587361 [Biscogniauxia mediterranea]